MVYFAAGVSAFTGIVESFFVIERGQYQELGLLMLTVAMITLLLPIVAVILLNPARTGKRKPR
jgi:hypothetical protein